MVAVPPCAQDAASLEWHFGWLEFHDEMSKSAKALE